MELSDAQHLKPRYDVVVVGAGMVGASVAIGLSRLGLTTLVVEAYPVAFDRAVSTPSYDARSTALSFGSRNILVQLGLWEALEGQATAINEVHVSEQGRFGVTRMLATELDCEALGYVMPNQVMGQVLLQQLHALDIDILANTSITDVRSEDGGKRIRMQHAKQQSLDTCASLLVIADGNQSSTANLLGITTDVQAYRQHALISNLTTELSNQGVAYERFTASGPLAMLPIADNVSSLIWTQPSEDIDHYLQLEDKDFCIALEQAFGDRLGRIVKLGQRNSYPLSLSRISEQYRSGVVVLGNAAHSLHPVAGQGFNLALRGVAVLLQVLGEAKLAKRQLGEVAVLKQVVEQQAIDQRLTITMSDQLVKLFGSPSLLSALARDVGLVGLNNTPIMKQYFARQAMGLAGKEAQFCDYFV